MARPKKRIRTKDFNMKRYRKRNKTLQERKIFSGATCEQVPVEDIKVGDFVIYWDAGWRAAEVQKNHKGYKHRWIRIKQRDYKGVILKRSKKITENQIKEAWRKIEVQTQD